MSNKSMGTQTALSLPKGGGAVKGIGETFQANLFSGTGNHSLPITLSPGRNGFGPKFSLEYSSGNGNGIFGLGWQLSLPRVTRKTEKGLPRYDDDDVFVMSGAEDLVRCLKKVIDPDKGQVTWVAEAPLVRSNFAVFLYRPRTEGAFARIERWVHNSTGDTHWRTITKDNVTSLFGSTPASRLTDPADDRRVYEWLLQETFDAFGNHILYEYAADDPVLYADGNPDVHLPEIFEQRRVATQRYIRRIYYGNLPEPLVDAQQNPITYPDGSAVGYLRDGRRYAFEVVFDYGDWDVPTVFPHPEPLPEVRQELFGADIEKLTSRRPVPIRDDRFSHFRAGFDIRTLRRCRRVLMFHHFAELGGPTLVRSTDFIYSTDPDTQVSLLTEATVTGYDKDGDGLYRSASMPPVVFTYSAFKPHEQSYQSLTVLSGDMPPLALNNPSMALVDLFGDGLPDILHTGPEGFCYWRNLGNGVLDRPRVLAQMPAGISLDQPGVGFGDMAGNGIADLLVNAGPLPGFFETTPDGAWKRFTPYEAFPGFLPQAPNVRMLDLTGDGRSDVLVTQDQQFLWFPCLGEKGFALPQAIARSHDLDQFPDVYFDDPAGRVRLADMTGDGLNDIVLVHDGRIDYWPNLGYGRFGKRITMDNAPRLETDFDPKRLFLADLNGTGCADLVYVDFRKVHFWFNQSGNAWSERRTILGTPSTSNADAVEFADIFGTGTATLLWSRDFTGTSDGSYKALDFCGGVKPYVLVAMDNSMGATTRVRYAPSTRYFLEDQANGTPWITSLPFPVQVVDKVEIIDHIGKTKLVRTYKYHHGFYDGREREFCGFGRVDEFDTESFEDFSRPDLHGDCGSFTNDTSAYHVPPVETRSWFHTGVYFDDRGSQPLDYRDLTNRFRQEYYGGDGQAAPLDEHDVDTGETPAEAYRALRGAQLRTEVYACDGSDKADHPYQVAENRYRITQLQPSSANRHAVYFSHRLESLTLQYERNPSDPRTSHELTLEIDAFGNPLKTLSMGYGRRQPDSGLPTQADRDRQTQTFVTYTETRYSQAIDDPRANPDVHRAPLPSATLTYELTGFAPVSSTERFSHAEWVADDFGRIKGAAEIGYEEQASPTVPQKRLIERVRTYYRKDDLSDLLPLGVIEPLALPGESHKLAFTAGLLERIYGNRVDEAILGNCRYIRGQDQRTWWIPTGRIFYSPNETDTPADELAFARQHFFAPYRARDPFGNTALTLSDPYVLLVNEASDALGNRTLAEQDYRLLQPFRITDPNGNRGEVVFDALGLVAGSAIMGKSTETLGDSLTGFAPNLTPEQRGTFLADPLAHAVELLGSATTRIVYDLERYQRERQPVFAATLTRETHASDPVPAGGLKVQVQVSYSDGFGREIQKKLPAEPGPLTENGPVVSPRWVGSGWTIFNNKGKPVKQYEPFFDDTHVFRFDHQAGVSSTLFYDPMERVVATLHPSHTWEKVVFDPWRQVSWDVNDTALIEDPKNDPDVGEHFGRLASSDYLPTWYGLRQSGELGAAEQSAAAKTAVHANTPSVAHADSLGRPFLTIAHNRFERNGAVVEERYATRVMLDIEGNQREVSDAFDRIVIRYGYDMLGTPIYQASMEAGERWMLSDVAGQPVFAWDSRDHQFRTAYDPLRRPVETFLREGGGSERLIGRMVYGESRSNPEANNLRSKVVQVFDQAGVMTTEDYDFKGNLLQSRRQLAREYKAVLDWSAAVPLETEVYTSSSRFDALNRPTKQIAPDNSVYRPAFNEANLLEKVDVHLRGATVATPFVANIDYNARGQRTRIDYGNGARTIYEYDPLTFRLTRLTTTRPAGLNGLATQLFKDARRVQDLGYTYDPSGNLTRIADDAFPALFFANQSVDPAGLYIYDAMYRLIEAQGRESVGQSGLQLGLSQTTYRDFPYAGLGAQPFDPKAVRNYTERYEYDAAGNFLLMSHQAQSGAWQRDYRYEETSLIEPGKFSNRLSVTLLHPNGSQPLQEAYTHDAHGNMTAMPHLSLMQWDFKDQLQATARQIVNEGTPETTYYVYDATGQRVRKITERANGTRKGERIYLGGFEVYREYGGNGTSVSLERETLHVMDDNQRIALVETRTQGDDGSPAQLVRYQLGNHLGSASLELDETGQLISYEEYSPYGSTSYQAGRSAAEVSSKRYRYTGIERDEETGFSYHGARYYVLWLGRWSRADPSQFQLPKSNPYAYAALNPLRFIDLSGHAPEPPPELIRDVEEWLHEARQIGSAKDVEIRAAQLEKEGQDLFIKYLEQRQDLLTASIARESKFAEARSLRNNLVELKDRYARLFERVRNLPGAANTRETPWKTLLEEKLNQGGAPLDVKPPSGGTQGPPSEPPPSGTTSGPPPEEGGTGIRGKLKGIFGKLFGNKVVRTGLKAAEWAPVLTASTEGEALGAVTLIVVAANIPLANVVIGVGGLIVLGAIGVDALYSRWKGPTADPPPNLNVPESEEQIGPVRQVAHVEPPPPPPSVSTTPATPSVPNTLRMRQETTQTNKSPKPFLSLTYDLQTGTTR